MCRDSVGARWSPFYGKISLMAELPVHFQTYVWLGGGAAALHRESIVYCKGVVSQKDGTCSDWLKDDKVSWLAADLASKLGLPSLDLFSYRKNQLGAFGLSLFSVELCIKLLQVS